MTLGRVTAAGALGGLCAFLVALVCAAPASALVYWTVTGFAQTGTSVGRANLDGSNPDNGFLASPDKPCGIAVDDEYLYWTHRGTTPGSGGIARARLDGTEVDLQFITTRHSPCGVAVNDTHIYWADWENGALNGGNKIGRANLDGSNPDSDFITAGQGVCGLDVDDEYVYWARQSRLGAIGRAKLDGTQVDQSFIPAATFACDVAVNSTHLYWGHVSEYAGDGSVGRANINGSGANVDFIPNSAGVQSPCGIAVDDEYVYWGNAAPVHGESFVGRAKLNGTEVDPTFIATPLAPCGVAVTPHAVPPPSCSDLDLQAQAGERLAIRLDCTAENAFTYELADPPGHGELTGFDPEAGTVRYTPEAGFTGKDSFTYRATNAGGPSAPATVSLVVRLSNNFKIARVKRNRKRGTAAVRVKLPGAGKLRVRGAGVKRASKAVSGPRTLNLRVRAAGKKAKRLRRKGKVVVKAQLTYRPVGGAPRTKTKKIRLVKR